MNGNLIVGAVIVLMAAAAVYVLYRNRRAGKCSCGCSCGACCRCCNAAETEDCCDCDQKEE